MMRSLELHVDDATWRRIELAVKAVGLDINRFIFRQNDLTSHLALVTSWERECISAYQRAPEVPDEFEMSEEDLWWDSNENRSSRHEAR